MADENVNEGGEQLSAEEQAAIARGDVFIPAAEEKTDMSEFDPELLRTITGEELPVRPDKTEAEPFIPKARLDELSQQVKTSRDENAQLRAELEELKAGKTVENETVVDVVDNWELLETLNEQYEDARLEGDAETAKSINRQMEKLRIQIAKDELNSEKRQGEVATSLLETAKAAIKLYPFLDENSDSVDHDAIAVVLARRGQLERDGKTPAEALRIAVEEKGPRFAKLNGVAVAQDNPKPNERETEALRRAADTSVRQPPTLAGRVDKESFTLDVTKMTDKQIMALPEEVKAKLRGDVA